jgi:quercetin dioxygenase-like cupin family protein
MSIEVFDYRSDGPRGLNFFVKPECRARFMTIRPGEAAPFHHHQLGQEVFVVMEGRGLFVIGDDEAVLEAGQACVARSGERHFVGPADENPMTLFLCVSRTSSRRTSFSTSPASSLRTTTGHHSCRNRSPQRC